MTINYSHAIKKSMQIADDGVKYIQLVIKVHVFK